MLSVRVRARRGEFALDVAFEAETPGVIALVGASGSGKTTTIDAIAGLIAPTTGRVEIDGALLFDAGRVDVPVERRRLGVVFQDGRLFPHRSVLGNLRYGERRAPAGSREIALDAVVDLLGLAPLLERRPHQLSGGERKRVAIGRALLSQPRLLLLDEPLTSLDPARREEVLPYLERLRDRFRLPIVYVSHQFEEVLRLATHVVLLDAGRVAVQGKLAEVSLHPALRALLGPDAASSVVPGEVETLLAGGLARLRVGAGRLVLPAESARVGEHILLHVRARDAIVATEAPRGLGQANQLEGTITAIGAESASSRLVEVDVGGARLLSRVASERANALGLAAGMRVWLIVNDATPRGAVPSSA